MCNWKIIKLGKPFPPFKNLKFEKRKLLLFLFLFDPIRLFFFHRLYVLSQSSERIRRKIKEILHLLQDIEADMPEDSPYMLQVKIKLKLENRSIANKLFKAKPTFIYCNWYQGFNNL
jgi:hypothetical protein